MEKTYDCKIAEPRIQLLWEKEKIFVFAPREGEEVYSIDTPPPTVSGKMHIGHAFSYSQQDFIARYQRMQGKNVFYPFGTDDNGLPTERLIEKLKNVKSTKMDRSAFVGLCNKTLTEIKPAFVADWKRIGMSCDFSSTYSTIDPHCIQTSQLSFLDLYKKNKVYRHAAPTMWCVQCQTAIAQADLEDKEKDSTFNDILFSLGDGKTITIATTRPELLAACVCLHVHPDDPRYKTLIGKEAIVPLFHQKIPIFADASVDREKGSGVLMICSYGDKFDVEAVKKRNLTPRTVFTLDGKLNSLAGAYAGLTITEARKTILADLEKEKLLPAKKPIKHTVNVHERCGTEIEFLSSFQWFVKVLDVKQELITLGGKISWHPSPMFLRYKHWIEGLQWDWCISRQRHFGVPFPVWYCSKCGEIHVADAEMVKKKPVDPLVDTLRKKCTCGSTTFIGERDVMDTWATSSVTPEIVLNWISNKKFGYKTSFQLHPMSLRPQAHDIIRTWAFYTIVKSYFHFQEFPWKDIVISGHVLDAKGEAMHKSKGNVIDPAVVLEKYSADALRYAAASTKLGEDVRYLEKDLVTGQKTVTKLWNAAQFSLIHLEGFGPTMFTGNLEAMDAWIFTKLDHTIATAKQSFDDYEYSKAKAAIDYFFW
ncbi:valine--tRNA ligase, partial [Candidatus Woesearchaeota archaeon]|nr:valine--tRNA ligase [Candidatus Woesearchaeota archaeon]